MTIINTSGLPRTDEEIRETLDTIKRELIKGEVYPIMIQFPIIIEALSELLFRRRAMDRQEEEAKNMSDVYDGIDI